MVVIIYASHAGIKAAPDSVLCLNILQLSYKEHAPYNLTMMLRITNIIVLCILICNGHKLDTKLNHEQWKEFEEFLEWKKTKQSREYNINEFVTRAIGFNDNRKNYNRGMLDPPPINQTILMARYVVNQAGN